MDGVNGLSNSRNGIALGTDTAGVKTAYVGNDIGELKAIRASDGVLKWTYSTGLAVHSHPAIGRDGTIYFGSHDRTFRAVTDNGASYTDLWSKFGPGVHSSAAIAAGGALFIGSYDYPYTFYKFK